MMLNKTENSAQLERIRNMERALDASAEAIAVLCAAMEEYEKVYPQIEKLAEYYHGGLWIKDFNDDCSGKIPQKLKRGVLSEDAVYDLLEEQRRLMERMEAMAIRAGNDALRRTLNA